MLPLHNQARVQHKIHISEHPVNTDIVIVTTECIHLVGRCTSQEARNLIGMAV